MTDKYFLSATGTDLTGPAAAGRVLWSGHCAVAEYAFEEPSSLPRWTLPEETEVLVFEDRVLYRDVTTGATGDLRWSWPQHLRVQPGSRETGRYATATQIQLVCAGPGDTFPALVFAGGAIDTVRDADRMANVLRQSIARYRVEHAAELGVPAPQVRVLSRLVIGPEFNNYPGGEGQTVLLLGSMPVEPPVAPRRSPVYGMPPEPLGNDAFLDAYAATHGVGQHAGPPAYGSHDPGSYASGPSAQASGAHAAGPAPQDHGAYAPAPQDHGAYAPAARDRGSHTPAAQDRGSYTSDRTAHEPGAYAAGPAAEDHGAYAPAAQDQGARATGPATQDHGRYAPATNGPESPAYASSAAARDPGTRAYAAQDAGSAANAPGNGPRESAFTGDPGSHAYAAAPQASDNGGAWGGAESPADGPQPAAPGTAGFAPTAGTPSWPMAGRAEFGATPPQALRPGFDPEVEQRPARPADDASLHGTGDLDARAADLAARVANLVSATAGLEPPEARTTNLSAYLGTLPPSEEPKGNRAEQVRRTAARLAANSARGRNIAPRRSPEDELDPSTQGHQHNV